MPDAGQEAAPVGLDGHPPAPAVAALAASEVGVDGLCGEVQPGRHAAEHAHLCRTMGLTGGAHAKRAHTRLPLAPRDRRGWSIPDQ